MSELKIIQVPKMTNIFGRVIGVTEYYLKSEADAIIAEKDKEIAELKHQVWEADERAIDAGATCHEKMQESDHHKYKRCLAMAKYCELREDEFGGDFAKRWLKKWRKLAEKFKPNNSTAQ